MYICKFSLHDQIDTDVHFCFIFSEQLSNIKTKHHVQYYVGSYVTVSSMCDISVMFSLVCFLHTPFVVHRVCCYLIVHRGTQLCFNLCRCAEKL